eukprot:CAMPEP_0117441602 /NCGR_PEP_ID=MMETSP0759-20121206/3719_1 /TAXON_ID=63605 /ORGANISM="Percolomonas cosmopolitus, Strain WS" /LENGTH=981 /DNA_ID=CAMNT_0005233461 /DNA_START=329 /DNA_END=3274 /DNA_ORIENTATION=+
MPSSSHAHQPTPPNTTPQNISTELVREDDALEVNESELVETSEARQPHSYEPDENEYHHYHHRDTLSHRQEPQDFESDHDGSSNPDNEQWQDDDEEPADNLGGNHDADYEYDSPSPPPKPQQLHQNASQSRDENSFDREQLNDEEYEHFEDNHSDDQESSVKQAVHTATKSPPALASAESFNSYAMMSQSPRDYQRDSLSPNSHMQQGGANRFSFRPDISPYAKQLKQDHISMRAKKVLEESNRKLQEIAQQLEEKYNTFSYQPKINEEYVMKKERSKFHDSIDERVHEKEQYYKKMEQRKQDQMQSSYTYKPEISTYSKTLERQEPIYERLYKLRKVTDGEDPDESRDSLLSPPNSARRRSTGTERHSSGQEEFTFQPQINDSHQHILAKRKGKIEDRMYQDALIREEKREQEKRHAEQEEDQKRQLSSQISSHTQRLAKQRIEKEMQIAFEKVATQRSIVSHDIEAQNKNPPAVIDYVQLGHCLALLGLFKSGNSQEERRSEQEVRIHEEIWNLMDPNDEEFVTYSTFRSVLGPLINPELFFNAQRISEADSGMSLDKQTVKHLSARIKELSVNKLAYYKTSNLLKDSRAATRGPKFEEPTFAPKINNVSKNIDTRSKKRHSQPSGPRYEILFQKNNEKQYKIDRLKRSVDEKVMKECSFKPQLQTKGYRKKTKAKDASSNRFEKLYSQHKKDPKVKTQYVSPEEKELANCTFQPDTRASKQYRESLRPHSSVNRTQIKGFEKQIARMKKAQKERNYVNNFYDSLRKEIDVKWKNRMKHNGDEVEFQPTEVKPFNFHLDQRKRSRPLLYMDVNLGPGRTGRIGIHENDDPAVLAKNFAISYRLDQVLRARLEDLIQQNMESNNIPMGTGGTPKSARGQNSNSPRATQKKNFSTQKSPAAAFAGGSHNQQRRAPEPGDQYEDEYSNYEDEDVDDFHASPIVMRGESPVRRQQAPHPEPSPSRRLYDSLNHLREFAEGTTR